MRIIPKQKPNDETAPYWNFHTEPQAGNVVTLKCPNGHIGSLSGHRIKASGDVEPSVVCPRDGCGFHDFVRLDGWAEEAGANA